MQPLTKTVDSFSGIKNDTDAKQTPIEFLITATNFNFPVQGTKGMSKILFPSQVNRLGTSAIDGLFEYRYLDGSNVLQTEVIAVANGIVWKNALTTDTPVQVTFSANPTNTVNRTFHGFNNGDAVSFSVGATGALPASLTASVIYFVINSAANTFQVATTPPGSAIVFATAGTTPTQYVERNPTYLKTGLTKGKCTFATFQDNLFIFNGKNYPQVYYGASGVIAEMGAPVATVTATAGAYVDVGSHYYAMTYVTAGGEEIIGSVSNTITISTSAKKVSLAVPEGYPGTLSRKVYRTKAGGTTLYLITDSVTALADNTTLTYLDVTPDASLSATVLPSKNNELPKPYFGLVANEKLYAAVADKYPTQLFITDTSNQVIDTASYTDISNYGDDNTPISSLNFDYNKVILGTGKNLIFIDPATGDLVRTRGYTGIKDGYSAKIATSFGDFPGGLMFVSSLNDVRLMQGTQAAAVFQTIDNLRTDNWAQDIRGSLDTALKAYSNITAEFYDNKYHLVIDGKKWVFDIRTNGWTMHNIQSASYTSNPTVLAVINNLLYNGQADGNIELEYQNLKYRGEEVLATLESPFIEVSSLYKWLKKIIFWFTASTDTNVSLTVTLDENVNFAQSETFSLIGAIFDSTYFDSNYFVTTDSPMDYKIANINNPCRWAQWYLTCSAGNITLRKIDLVGTPLSNREAV